MAAEFRAAIDASIAGAQRSKGTGMAVPASPLRRMDSGAIGNVAASYPLAVWSPEDPRMAATMGFLLERCLYKGAFFQDMIHSGINAYLTLQMAQVLLRAGDMRCHQLIRDTAAVATPTGQWPEAIHPHTLGGCMGDGQHVWASAEWVLMMRNLFLREEGRTLILASGIPREWLRAGEEISFGPGPSRFGRVTVRILPAEDGAQRGMGRPLARGARSRGNPPPRRGSGEARPHRFRPRPDPLRPSPGRSHRLAARAGRYDLGPARGTASRRPSLDSEPATPEPACGRGDPSRNLALRALRVGRGFRL